MDTKYSWKNSLNFFDCSKPPDEAIDRLLRQYFNKCDYRRGSIMSLLDLNRVKLFEAAATVLVADKAAADSDSEDAINIMRVVSIKNFKPDARVIVQLLQYHNKVLPASIALLSTNYLSSIGCCVASGLSPKHSLMECASRRHRHMYCRAALGASSAKLLRSRLFNFDGQLLHDAIVQRRHASSFQPVIVLIFLACENSYFEFVIFYLLCVSVWRSLVARLHTWDLPGNVRASRVGCLQRHDFHASL